MIALIAGVICGYAASVLHAPLLTTAVAWIEPVGAVWVNAIRMTVIPLVVSLLFVSVASRADAAGLGRLGGLTLLVFVGLFILWTLVVYVLAPWIYATFPINPAAAALHPATDAVHATPDGLAKTPAFSQWLVDLIPVNPVKAASDGALLPLLVFTLAFGLAGGRLEPKGRMRLLDFFKAVGDAMIILLRWIIAWAPVGVFALTTALVARIGLSALGAFAHYVVAVCGLLSLQIVSLYAVVRLAGVGVRRFARSVLPAQLVALSSRSSLAALPALIEGANDVLGLRPDVGAFVLPLAVSTFKFASSSVVVMSSLFIARLYGVDLDAAQMGVIAASSVLVSFTTPGIPSGGLLVLAPVFAQAHIPLEGIGLLIGIDAIPDIFKTVLNVTANMTVATVVSRFAGARTAAPGVTR